MNQTVAATEVAPSSARLIKATLIALGAAVVLLITAVLPAEYGIDPTGVGRLVGLTQMGEAKSGVANTSSDRITKTADGGTQVQIVIAPYSGREIKAELKAGAEMTYAWSTGGAAIYYDMHGHTVDEKQERSFAKGTGAEGQGVMKADFDGVFGGYWENKSMAPVTLTITAKGTFTKMEPVLNSLVSGFKPSSGSSDAPYLTDLPMRPWMQRVMQTAADNVWAWQGYVSDEKGFRDLFPKNDEEWKKAENASLLLADVTNNVLIPGRRIDEPEWDKAALNVRAIALKAAAAANRKDQAGYEKATGQLYDACQACHVRYDENVKAYYRSRGIGPETTR